MAQFSREDVATYFTKKIADLTGSDPNITSAAALASVKKDLADLKEAGNLISTADLAAGFAGFAKDNGLSDQQFQNSLAEIDTRAALMGSLGINNTLNLRSMDDAGSAATLAAAAASAPAAPAAPAPAPAANAVVLGGDPASTALATGIAGLGNNNPLTVGSGSNLNSGVFAPATGSQGVTVNGPTDSFDIRTSDDIAGLSDVTSGLTLPIPAALGSFALGELEKDVTPSPTPPVNNINLDSNPMRVETVSGNNTELVSGPGGKTASQVSFVRLANGNVELVQPGEMLPAGTLVDAETYAKFRGDNNLSFVPGSDETSIVNTAGAGAGAGLDENGLTAEQAAFSAGLTPAQQSIYLQTIKGTNAGTALPDVLKDLLGQGFNLDEIGRATGLLPNETPSMYPRSEGGVAGPGQMLPQVLNSQGIMAPFAYTPFPTALATNQPAPAPAPDVMALTAGLRQPAAAAGAPAPVQPNYAYNPAFGTGTTGIDIFEQPTMTPKPFVPTA